MTSPSPNPRGRSKSNQPVLREKHLRFIAACFANRYNAGETERMLVAEFALTVTIGSVKMCFEQIQQIAPEIDQTLKAKSDFSFEAITAAVKSLKPRSTARLPILIDEYFKERRRIAEDPTYGVAFADKHRRMLKLDQNIQELDTPKTFAKGSYPTSKDKDGSMTFEKFELANKDHAEQRKQIQALGELADGAIGGDVVIQIVDNPSPEESETQAQREAQKKMDDLKAKKVANKPATTENKEEKGAE